MEGITAAVMLKAMDGLSRRMEATAQNIANAGTSNYRPVRVNFESALKVAAENGVDAISAVQPALTSISRDQFGGDLRVDLELASAAMTGGRYATLADLLNRQMQIDALAISGSRQS
jgi:flagellar basal-body rod protein FlgB